MIKLLILCISLVGCADTQHSHYAMERDLKDLQDYVDKGKLILAVDELGEYCKIYFNYKDASIIYDHEAVWCVDDYQQGWSSTSIRIDTLRIFKRGILLERGEK